MSSTAQSSSKAPLKKYQQENVDWIKDVKRGLLADEPGLGKSRSALEGVAAAGAREVLIVAPSLIINTGVWHDEVELWGDDDTRYVLVPYSQLNKRVKTGKTASSNKPVKVLDQYVKQHWDAVILDEAHYIKGRNSKWTWAMDQLGQRTDMIMALTGTPIPNWAHEVYNILRLIYPDQAHPGKDLGSFWRWAGEWFNTEASFFSQGRPTVGGLLECTPACMRRNADDPCQHYRNFAAANFGSHYMRHLREDHLDLPPLDIVTVDTPLTSSVRRMYAELKRNFATTINGEDHLAWSQGAKNVMLDKMTTSPWLIDKRGEPRGGKLEYIRDIVRKRDDPTLIFAHYRDSVEAAAAVAESTGKSAAFVHGGTSDRQNAAAVTAFKRGRVDVLVGSLETIAEGLTLTIADHAIFLERSFKPSRNTQATYRIHRLGQDRPCKITRLITPRTVDSGKEILLNEKNDHQMRTLTAADYLRVA